MATETEAVFIVSKNTLLCAMENHALYEPVLDGAFSVRLNVIELPGVTGLSIKTAKPTGQFERALCVCSVSQVSR